MTKFFLARRFTHPDKSGADGGAQIILPSSAKVCSRKLSECGKPFDPLICRDQFGCILKSCCNAERWNLWPLKISILFTPVDFNFCSALRTQLSLTGWMKKKRSTHY
ncbi:hypothetical protein NIASO_06415 [Niabella soli DSM 19437]|uniref:Uncharacterized protein n=1 Tax=Niabella soli DSM 19437 TaxID=929713 RepID=W0F2X8_9BACT|nr:hypothetical protein NIASO_06415 [Niabella soli DSM 19437]